MVYCGALEECLEQPHCVSPISCVPKQNNRLRRIVDLRTLNNFCDCSSYKAESIDTVIEFVKPKDKLITIDIKNGP